MPGPPTGTPHGPPTGEAHNAFAAVAVMAATAFPLRAQITFAPQVTYAPGNQPETTALGDFDGDGDFDAAVTSDAPDKITIAARGPSRSSRRWFSPTVRARTSSWRRISMLTATPTSR
jgi:hypothetical protein